MKTISIDVVSPSDDHLLLIGIPFVEGTFFEEDSLTLTLDKAPPGGTELPIWYSVRNTWRDGSIRWVFLHSRIPSGSHRLALSILKEQKGDAVPRAAGTQPGRRRLSLLSG